MNEYNKRRLNELPEIEPYFNDISQGLAERAYYATSHSPDRAASLIKSEYAVCLLNDLNRVKKIAERAKKRNVELAEDPVLLTYCPVQLVHLDVRKLLSQ